MRLPDGVSYHPRRSELISIGSRAVIEIESQSLGYQINNRSFDKAIAPYLHGVWADFDRMFQLSRQRIIGYADGPITSPVIYSGAEHNGHPKSPNITVLPNLTTKVSHGLLSSWKVLGCTMGHYHPGGPSDYRIQEVYEFQSYGMLAFDREAGEIELWIAKEGDKVAVSNGCHMTLYNLGDEHSPLVTLDFADPARNPSNKKLISRQGPALLGYYNDLEVIFALNRLYINNPDHQAGVPLNGSPGEGDERQVRISRGARLDLGQLLYEELTQNPDPIGQFARLGIRIKKASPETFLEPLPANRGSRLYFSRPLVEATRMGTEVYRYFFPNEKEGFRP